MIDISKYDKESERQLSNMRCALIHWMHMEPKEIIRAELFKREITKAAHYILEGTFGFRWDETKRYFIGLTDKDYRIVRNEVTKYALKFITN